MSAECFKCGYDLPYEGDCEVCSLRAENESRFDAGYAQAIKDVVEALRGRGRGPEGKGSNYKGLIYDDAAELIEDRFPTSRNRERDDVPPKCDCGQSGDEKHKHTCSYGRWLLVREFAAAARNREEEGYG